MIKRSASGAPDVQDKLEAALVRYAETNDPADHAELVRLYETHTRFKAGCGTCIAGRKLFMKGLGEIASGNGTEGLSKIRGSMRSASFKFERLKAGLGL